VNGGIPVSRNTSSVTAKVARIFLKLRQLAHQWKQNLEYRLRLLFRIWSDVIPELLQTPLDGARGASHSEAATASNLPRKISLGD